MLANRPIAWVLSFCLALCFAASAAGQSIVVEDTLDWRDYYPLQIGNTWEYESGNTLYGPYPEWYERREVIADTLIRGLDYFVHQTRAYDPSLHLLNSKDEFLRYDLEKKAVVSLIQQDTSFVELVWPEPALACDLSAAFGSTIVCEGQEVRVWGAYIEPSGSATGEPVARAWKEFSFSGAWSVYLINGEGNWGFVADWEPGYERNLIYMQIGTSRTGTSVVATGVGQLPHTQLPKGTITVFPNPAFDRITVTYDVDHGQPMTLEVYDVMGRRVFEDHIGPAPTGQQTTTLDVSPYPAGVYFVRLDGEASVRSFAIIR